LTLSLVPAHTGRLPATSKIIISTTTVVSVRFATASAAGRERMPFYKTRMYPRLVDSIGNPSPSACSASRSFLDELNIESGC
jgi:hypothetical protein